MTTRLECAHQTQLLFRADPSEDCGAFGDFRELLVRNLFQFATGERDEFSILLASLQPDLLRDGAGGDEMVAGNHLDSDAGHLAFAHGFDGFGSRRVYHPLQAEEGQPRGDMTVFELRVVGIRVAADEGEHAQPACSHLLDGLMHGRLVERDEFAAFVERVRAAVDQALHCADFVNDPAARSRVVERGMEHMLGIERNHVHPRQLAVRVGGDQPSLLASDQQRGLGRVALHLEAAVFVAHKLSIIAEHAGTQALGERGLFRHVDR